MDIYEIKQRTKDTQPYFFSRSTLRFFGQTMKSFRVSRQQDGRYEVRAKSKDSNGRNMGDTVRFFNPANNELERA